MVEYLTKTMTLFPILKAHTFESSFLCEFILELQFRFGSSSYLLVLRDVCSQRRFQTFDYSGEKVLSLVFNGENFRHVCPVGNQ